MKYLVLYNSSSGEFTDAHSVSVVSTNKCKINWQQLHGHLNARLTLLLLHINN